MQFVLFFILALSRSAYADLSDRVFSNVSVETIYSTFVEVFGASVQSHFTTSDSLYTALKEDVKSGPYIGCTSDYHSGSELGIYCNFDLNDWTHSYFLSIASFVRETSFEALIPFFVSEDADTMCFFAFDSVRAEDLFSMNFLVPYPTAMSLHPSLTTLQNILSEPANAAVPPSWVGAVCNLANNCPPDTNSSIATHLYLSVSSVSNPFNDSIAMEADAALSDLLDSLPTYPPLETSQPTGISAYNYVMRLRDRGESDPCSYGSVSSMLQQVAIVGWFIDICLMI